MLVTLKDKAYEVVISDGLRAGLGKRVRDLWTPRKVLVVTDENVGTLYLNEVVAALSEKQFTLYEKIVPAGESSKSFTMTTSAIEQMANAGFTRGDAVIALGGGVVGDLAGVIASLYMRGISFMQIPTSLTAMVDASVGGKTAVNLGDIKNIAGTFYQPDGVLIDPSFLQTLPDRDLIEGYAEVVKTSALAGGAFFEQTGQIGSAADIRTKADDLIRQSVAYKAQIVMSDERESGQRKVLNFGHTFGHAIELLAHGELRHGEAVAIGMATISQRFETLNQSTPAVTAALVARLEVVGLPTHSKMLGTPEFYRHLVNDKKNMSGTLQLVALPEIGRPTIVPMPLTDVAEFVNSANDS
jgi:3-dehydroquinate synthase